MMQMIIYFLMILNSFFFLMMNHPLTMGFILMSQTILISTFTGMFTFMYWFSYSLFLIFMGGMLILFMYMTSLASNETFKFSLKMKTMMFLIMAFIMLNLFIFLIDFKNMIINNKTINEEILSMNLYQFSMEKNIFLLNKMYNHPMNFITILLVSYLFLTLIATVKITNIFQGPVRPKNI